ncbi:MAG: DNA repair protein RecN, partial [Bacillota bacterium]|nr:DNA repair protein RecN [Bacillota bacterium]
VSFADIRPDPVTFPEQGLDQVEYLLSANPGEPLRPLARIASGGEASRIMLAIKTILADVDQIPVLIFDEIDTGVSGQTAGKVGAKLLQLARGRQIFCITHMAQIAAMADEHWLIEKQVQTGRTRTSLRQLLEEERETELARLLSGGIADQTARQ